MNYREIVADDVPDLFAVRTATHENRLTLEQLRRLGITEESVKERIAGTFRGWLCEVDGRVVGFAMGDRATGEMWVIAVLPEHVGQGIGGELLRRVEAWLFDSGCPRLWLTTDVAPSLKARGFYRRYGWLDDRIEDGMQYMVKHAPDAGARRPAQEQPRAIDSPSSPR
jgi:GNAT superfamily N-acetyltransferase